MGHGIGHDGVTVPVHILHVDCLLVVNNGTALPAVQRFFAVGRQFPQYAVDFPALVRNNGGHAVSVVPSPERQRIVVQNLVKVDIAPVGEVQRRGDFLRLRATRRFIVGFHDVP